MRIEQYFLMTDYSLQEVILNGDSPIPTRVIDGVVQPVAPTTAEQRLARKNKLKARGTLLMNLLDKHQLKFNIHKDVKSLLEAIEKRFGGNKETKKVHKTLPKQQYENFTGSSSESLDQIHDRLQKLISQLEILGESLSQEDINLKFLRSLPTEWRTHTLIWRNKTNLKDESLDDLFNSLKIYEAEVKISAVASVSTASTKVHVSTLPNVDTLSDAIIYSFFVSQSNSPQLDNDDLKQIDADDLEEMDLKWQMAMLTTRARRFLHRTHFAREYRSPRAARNKDTQRRNFPVETSTTNALVLQYDGVKSYDWSFQSDEEPTNYALMAFTSSSSSSSDNENLSQLLASQTNDKTGLGYDNQVFTSTVFDCDDLISSDSDVSLPPSIVLDRYQSGKGYHAVPPPYTGTFMPPKLDLVFYDAPTANETVPTILNVELKDDSEGEPMPPQKAPSFVQTSEHVKTPRPSVKPVEHLAPAENLRKDILKNYAMRENHQHYARMTHPNPHRHVVPTAVLTRSRLVPLTAARPVTIVVPHINVTRPRPAKTVITKPYSSQRMPIHHRPSPKPSNFPQKVTIVKAPQVNAIKGVKRNWGNPQHALKDKGVIDSGCSRHMTGNISYLSNFEEIKGGYVAFGGNPKGELKFNLFSVSQMCDKKNSVIFTDTECIILSSDFKLPDENHVLLRVPREKNMYNVDLKNIVPSGDLTCLFAKATLDESNLWHRRLGHINFKTMNKLVKGNSARGLPSKVFENKHTCVACKKGKQHRASCKTKPISSVSQPLQRVLVTKPHNKTPYELLLGRTPSIGFMRPFGYPVTILNTLDPLDPQNIDANATFKVKEPESEVHVSPSSSAKTKMHDDKKKREAKGKSHVKLSTGVRNLSKEFKDFSSNNTNEVNAASTPVPAVEPNSTDSTNTFSVVGPLNNAVSLNFKLAGKSSFVDPS
nr:ribonuclease H-like domain-containing protein [Tanacetum cinerariifolium]